MLSILAPLFLFGFKNNIGWGITFIIFILTFIFFRRIFFRYKYKTLEYYESYNNVSFFYFYAVVFLLLAILASFGIISELKQGNSIPIWGILALFGFWTFGILITYYTYQAKKESVLKKDLEPKEKTERKKIKKFYINYIMAFFIIATIISFLFGVVPLTLNYIVLDLIIIILVYLFLRIVFSKI